MLTLILLLGWMFFGYVMIIGALLIHVIGAERQGFKAFEWWANHPQPNPLKTWRDVFRCIWGLIVWPERLLYTINVKIPEYWDNYELY